MYTFSEHALQVYNRVHLFIQTCSDITFKLSSDCKTRVIFIILYTVTFPFLFLRVDSSDELLKGEFIAY